jgi:hypothetical protein
VLLVGLSDRRRPQRQPHDHVVAEAIQGVVGPGGRDPLDREVGPLRLLHLEQGPHDRGIAVDLVVVHVALAP